MKITAVFAVALLLSMFSFGEEQISVSVVDANRNPIENNTIDDQLVITTDDWLILDALLQGKTGTNVESRLSQFNLSSLDEGLATSSNVLTLRENVTYCEKVNKQ